MKDDYQNTEKKAELAAARAALRSTVTRVAELAAQIEARGIAAREDAQ
ncbi:hypothetical protein G8E10_17610 [Rhizobiaceae bacterium CRRU44]|uniref:Uncharacterized protein n=1 Tax=Ferranicluibacter rubi TaxID=2715133 RepID=A0AA43ZH47_9HYPH|nr:hypothetical protein [Ferranicluibacter rubi]NHT77534.1 hypothetical protein [Ferranicluibacter rubi]